MLQVICNHKFLILQGLYLLLIAKHRKRGKEFREGVVCTDMFLVVVPNSLNGRQKDLFQLGSNLGKAGIPMGKNISYLKSTLYYDSRTYQRWCLSSVSDKSELANCRKKISHVLSVF